MARPRKNTEERHRNRIDLRLRDADYEKLIGVSRRWGIPDATLLRTAFLIGWAECERRIAAGESLIP